MNDQKNMNPLGEGKSFFLNHFIKLSRCWSRSINGMYNFNYI